MPTVSNWNPFGVALDVTATAGTVTRTSATQFTVKVNVSWETYYSGAKTNYGMTATSGGSSATINTFGNSSAGGSGSLTGTYSISGNGAATKTITVTFKNFNNDNGDSATKGVSFSVSVPAWTSYTVTYNANGGTGAPANQTKWKNQTLTLSNTKPTRTGYTFQGWATSSSGSVAYSAGASYAGNAALTLYAVWKANTYTVTYNANGGTGAPSSQTKTYGTTLKLSSTKPTRTNYTFVGWGTSASATTVAYASGANYTENAAITLYAIWQLGYVKPRINNFAVIRCNSGGTAADDGTYAKITFQWACDQTIKSISVSWLSASGGSGSTTISTTSTSASKVFGGGALSVDSTYTITVTVTDAGGYSEAKCTLSGTKLAIDFLPDGAGAAVGKPAELEGVFDVQHALMPRGGFRYISLPEETDLNSVTTSGAYRGAGVSQTTYYNIPDGVGGGFMLEVLGDELVLKQRLSALQDYGRVWERTKDSSYWSEWFMVSAFGGQILWQGENVMGSGTTISLSPSVSKQPNGILLVFVLYDSRPSTYYGDDFYQSFFIHKKQIELHPDSGNTFILTGAADFADFAAKYLYINDTTITGHANNSASGTGASGITYTNAKYALRYVIGV